jgi:shikimate kinase
MTGTPGSRRDVKAPAAGRDTPVRAVVLVGFMGAGKTSVGRALGQRLGWRFVDLDDRVQERERRSIPEIFRDSGEAEFRRAESAALQELLDEGSPSPLVLAVGGGAFIQSANASLLDAERTPTIFLDAPVEELWQRCGAEPVERPLRRKEAEFKELYEARRPRYLRARLRVETSGRQIEQIVDEIVSTLGLQPPDSNKEK